MLEVAQECHLYETLSSTWGACAWGAMPKLGQPAEHPTCWPHLSDSLAIFHGRIPVLIICIDWYPITFINLGCTSLTFQESKDAHACKTVELFRHMDERSGLSVSNPPEPLPIESIDIIYLSVIFFQEQVRRWRP